MLQIIKELFPSYQIDYQSLPYQQNFIDLLSIIIDDDECYFVEIHYKQEINDQSYSDMINNLSTNLSSLIQKSIHVECIRDLAHDITQKEVFKINITSNNQTFTAYFSLEFLNIICQHIFKTTKKEGISKLIHELMCFRPCFIEPTIWSTLDPVQLRKIFHYLLTYSLVTPKMIALFFYKTQFTDISYFFSTQTYQEIQQELSSLTPDEDSLLLNLIYYIIELNLISFLKESTTSISILQEKQELLKFYQYYFYKECLMNIELKKYSFLPNQLLKIIQQSSYRSIISFLRYSHPDNIKFIKSYFSNDAYQRLIEDIKSTPFIITDSKPFLILLSNITEFSHKTFDELIQDFTDIDWEILCQECALESLILCIDMLKDHQKNNLQGRIKYLYDYYQKKHIIFPKIKKISHIDASNHCIKIIIYLKFLGLVSRS